MNTTYVKHCWARAKICTNAGVEYYGSCLLDEGHEYACDFIPDASIKPSSTGYNLIYEDGSEWPVGDMSIRRMGYPLIPL